MDDEYREGLRKIVDRICELQGTELTKEQTKEMGSHLSFLVGYLQVGDINNKMAQILTIIRFSHQRGFKDCNQGWGDFLDDLKKTT